MDIADITEPFVWINVNECLPIISKVALAITCKTAWNEYRDRPIVLTKKGKPKKIQPTKPSPIPKNIHKYLDEDVYRIGLEKLSRKFQPMVIEYAFKKKCIFCQKRFAGKLDHVLRVYGHGHCLLNACVDLRYIPAELGISRKFILDDLPIKRIDGYDRHSGSFTYSIALLEKHPFLDPATTLSGMKDQPEYYKNLYTELVVKNILKQWFEKVFLAMRLGIKLHVNFVFHRQSKLRLYVHRAVLLYKDWKNGLFGNTTSIKPIFTKLLEFAKNLTEYNSNLVLDRWMTMERKRKRRLVHGSRKCCCGLTYSVDCEFSLCGTCCKKYPYYCRRHRNKRIKIKHY
jgi:hypothetical protein